MSVFYLIGAILFFNLAAVAIDKLITTKTGKTIVHITHGLIYAVGAFLLIQYLESRILLIIYCIVLSATLVLRLYMRRKSIGSKSNNNNSNTIQ